MTVQQACLELAHASRPDVKRTAKKYGCTEAQLREAWRETLACRKANRLATAQSKAPRATKTSIMQETIARLEGLIAPLVQSLEDQATTIALLKHREGCFQQAVSESVQKVEATTMLMAQQVAALEPPAQELHTDVTVVTYWALDRIDYKNGQGWERELNQIRTKSIVIAGGPIPTSSYNYYNHYDHYNHFSYGRATTQWAQPFDNGGRRATMPYVQKTFKFKPGIPLGTALFVRNRHRWVQDKLEVFPEAVAVLDQSVVIDMGEHDVVTQLCKSVV